MPPGAYNACFPIMYMRNPEKKATELWSGIILEKELGSCSQRFYSLSSICFFFGTDTGSRTKGAAKKVKKTLLDMEEPVEEYTTAELYELCKSTGCYIPPRHKKNRPYMENQIRQEKKEEEWRKEAKKRAKKAMVFLRSLHGWRWSVFS